MLKKFILFSAFLAGFALMTGFEKYEEDLYDEYLQLQTGEDRILAFSGKNPSQAVDLSIGERVIFSEEKGYVGAVLTNKRFLAISSTSGKWLSESLSPGEENSAHLKVGEKAAMLVTDRRIVGFTIKNEEFAEYDLPFGGEIRDRDAGENFVIVAMSDRAVGLSSETGNFSEIEFGVGETFQSMEMATTLALINTEDNIYTFSGSTGSWSTRSRNTP